MRPPCNLLSPNLVLCQGADDFIAIAERPDI
jgi:hypothetical protein